jgi:hypothetical protein
VAAAVATSAREDGRRPDETEATRPATFAERWPADWASFDERWGAAWGANRIRTIPIAQNGQAGTKGVQDGNPQSDTLTAQDRAIRAPASRETPAAAPGDVCALHHLRRVEYDHGKRWRCRR